MKDDEILVKESQGGGSRVLIYDWVRLLATFYVVVGHSIYLNIQTLYGGVAYTLSSNINQAFFSGFVNFFTIFASWIYGFHMPLFFALSGAVLALKSIPDLDVFVKSKIKRLIIPYFLCAWLFMLPVKYLGNFYNKQGLLLAMQGVLSGIDSGHLWFLPALFWCMVIFVLIRKILSKKTNSIYLSLLISGIIQIFSIKLPFNIFLLKEGLNYIFWFTLGYVFEIERRQHESWNLRTTIFAFVVLTVIEILNAHYFILNSFFVIICGLFLTYLFSDLCTRLFKRISKNKCWKLIIRNLFCVYLFHDPLEYIALRIYMHFNFLSNSFGCYSYPIVRVFVIFVICIIIGECLHLFIRIFSKLLNYKKASLLS